ncbi:MAG: sigma-70 family RNA polymerase sigma factor [Gemmataceae bacterium]|nr:sigma-70 family RNA polymerase sigma factor [Gemmataceae bacterium]
MFEVTRILDAAAAGDTKAASELLPLVYDELRKLAAARMASENPGQTLDATALVHEAYVRLVGGDAAKSWNGRGHFFAAAAEAMRRILVENARRKKAEKRGGDFKRVAFDEANLRGGAGPDELLLLDEALAKLTDDDPEAAAIAKLRLFGGMTIDNAGEIVGVSRATAFRNWTYARAWLNAHLQDGDRG